jgi:hypothetical protein
MTRIAGVIFSSAQCDLANSCPVLPAPLISQSLEEVSLKALPNGSKKGEMMKAQRFVRFFVLVILGFFISIQDVNAARYTDNGDGTITDSETGLVWQQGFSHKVWEETAKYCDELVLASEEDWRLPRIDELRTIIDFTRPSPAVDPLFFVPGRVCTETMDASSLEATRANQTEFRFIKNRIGCPHYQEVWTVLFGDRGLIFPYAIESCDDLPPTFGIKCVREGPFWPLDPSAYLILETNKIVRDTFHETIWQRSDDGVKRTWQEASSYCADMSLGGYTDWYLPTIEDLMTLVDYTVYNPSLSTEVLDGHIDYYWSSTPNVSSQDEVWVQSFMRGGTRCFNKETSTYYVRCMRKGESGPFHTLKVRKSGSGNGLISSSPAGINCGEGCTEEDEEYRSGAVVRLDAEPYSPSVFTGWEGAGCSGTESCIVTMKSDMVIVAHFTKSTFTISGQVKTDRGYPVPGVTMNLGGAESKATTTDRSGYFSFSGVSNGVYN